MASSSPMPGMTPLQASSAMGVSPSTPAAPSRPGNLGGAVSSTPLPSAVSPSGSLEGRSLLAASTFLAPTPTHTLTPSAPLAAGSWRGARGASSGLHSSFTPAGSKSIEEEVDAFEAALDELMLKGDRFYDQIESSLSPSSHPAQIQQALSSLVAHLDTLLSTLATSPLGSLQPASPRRLDDAQQDNPSSPSPSLDQEIKALKDASNDVYERRMRLAEAAGVVAHVLAINAKRAGK